MARIEADRRKLETEHEPTPQPEREEPQLYDPGLRDLTAADAKAIVIRAGKQSLADQITDSAAALAYYGFMALPAVLLLALGFFSLIASPSAIDSLMERLETDLDRLRAEGNR